MKSRMERYYNSNNDFVGRAEKNEQLYRNKDYSMYSSNETVIDTNNEIDITKLKDIIKSREDYQRAKSYRNMLNDKKFDYDDITYEEDNYEEKNYDINSLLEKVKNEKPNQENEDKIRKLRNTQYDILSNLDIKSKKKELNEEELQKEQLQGLIDKVTRNASKETEKKEVEDPFDLLAELKAKDGNTIVTEPMKDKDIQIDKEMEVIKEAQKESEEDETSFYSDSFTFSKKDFEGLQDLHDDVKSGNKLIKILIFFLVIIILTIGVLVLDYFYHFLPFM